MKYSKVPNSVLFTKPVFKKGRYHLSEGEHDTNHGLEAARIFLETQAKRIMHALFPWVKKFKYFSQNETAADIYEYDKIKQRRKKSCKIYNLGHATQLIQVPGKNILTDPTFGSLNRLLYPEMTKSGIDPNKLPPIDVVLISHNHRDHVDEKSQKYLLKFQPQLLVPKGDLSFFKKLGFEHVKELDWYETETIKLDNGNKIQFTAVPADHWTGRGLGDANRSAANGWLINPTNFEGVFYFAGDTAKLSEEKMHALAWLLMSCEKNKGIDQLKICNFQPAGPNYTRKDMQSTHQSVLESLVTAFELAHHMTQLEEELITNPDEKKSPHAWLNHVATIFMHHNKYQLGPDRFNEALFIFDEVIKLLASKTDKELEKLAERERSKNFFQDLRHRNKAFIYEGAIKLSQAAAKIWPTVSETEQRNRLLAFLLARTHVPKIGEGIRVRKCFTTEDSIYRPDVTEEQPKNTSPKAARASL